MTIGASVARYGGIEVGQRVQFRRLVPAPTPQPSAGQWGRGGEVVSICTEHVVREIRPCDSGVLVTLRHADGPGEVRVCCDAYGALWGGFGGLEVVARAPVQMALRGLEVRAC